VALTALQDRAGNVTAHLNRLLADSGLGAADAALARELAMGVVRRRRTLEAVIRAFQSRSAMPRKPLDLILELGLYQLLFLQRVPAFAAVNEAVAQAGAVSPKTRAFVNGLLRNVARASPEWLTGDYHPGPDILPLSMAAYRRFDRLVFPDPAADPAAYLAETASLPDELAEKWLGQFGGLTGTLPVALHANARPPLVLRVNTEQMSIPAAIEALASAGVEAAPHVNGLSVVVTGHGDVMATELFRRGLLQPQDATATAVVSSADVQPGMNVLDLCSAPGTKTTHLAWRMQGRGRIVAADVNEEKLARVRENIERCGLTIVEPVLVQQIGGMEVGSFDLVLVDAPCSNTGVLARRPEARWRFSRQTLAKIARDQGSLLRLGGAMTRPGGKCIYSTCSIEPEENQQVIARFLRGATDLRLVKQHATPPAGADDPTQWSDGGYFAILSR
jgi:16S rRNA (cytosine967-C5)-methyltransferase